MTDSIQREKERRYSPAGLIEDARAALERGQITASQSIAQVLVDRHPQAPEAAEARTIIAKADSFTRAAMRAQAAAKERLLAGMVKERDDMRNLTSWRDRAAPKFINSRSWLGAYIMQFDDGTSYLRMKIAYVASDWLFINTYRFKVDGVDFVFEPESYGSDAVERDNGGGEIWEWWDVLADGDRLRFLQAVADAKNVTMRYEGRQYYRDRTIGPEERASLRRTLEAFRVLSGR